MLLESHVRVIARPAVPKQSPSFLRERLLRRFAARNDTLGEGDAPAEPSAPL